MATGTEMDILSTSGLFGGNHQAVNEWANEGQTLTPMLQMPLMSDSTGDSRHQTDDINQLWNTTVIVNTPLTGGGGAMAK